jgi:hypothetical protein
VRVGNPASLGMSQSSTADVVEQPRTPDVPVTAQIGRPLNALPTLRSSIFLGDAVDARGRTWEGGIREMWR